MRRALTRLFATPALAALAALGTLLVAGSPAGAQHAGYGYSYAPPPPAPTYAPAQGFGRAGTYLYGYGGVGTAPVHGPVVGHGYSYSYDYSYDYGQRPGHGHGRPAPDCGGRYGYSPCGQGYTSRYSSGYSRGHAYGQGHARGDYGRPARGYRDRDGYHDDRPPAYGRVEGGYAWIERGRRDSGYGCDCPRIPLYD